MLLLQTSGFVPSSYSMLNHGFSSWTHADPLDGNVEELLDELDVLSARLWQLLKGGGRGNVALPARQRRVLDLDLGQHLEIGWEARQFLAVVLVARCHLEFLEVVQDVELGQIQTRVAIDQARVAQHDEVQPAASSSSTGRDTVLGAHLLHVHTDVLFKFAK